MTIPQPITEPERQALAERYVLGDPTLDTTAFEAQMLEDETLAWAVAAAVEELGLIARASHCLTPASAVSSDAEREAANAVAPGGVRRSSQPRRISLWGSLTVAAACLALLCLGPWEIWPAALPPNPTSQATIDESLEMSQVAENWLAFETAFAEESPRAFESEAVAAVPVATNGADEEDWLVEAAQLYFAELESSES